MAKSQAQIVGLDNQIKYIKKHIISACKNRSFTKEELKLGHVNDIDHISNKGNRTLALLRILKQDMFGGEIMNGVRINAKPAPTFTPSQAV